MMLRGLNPYGSALTRPVTILLRNRLAHALARSALGAPERFSSCSRLSGVQMLNAELELGSPNELTEGFS